MADITPLLIKGSHIVRGYGDGGFTIRDDRYLGAQIIYVDEVLGWDVTDFDSLTLEDFTPLIERKDKARIVLLGCGELQKFLPSVLENQLKTSGLSVEVMNTGAACRTYNTLMSEGREIVCATFAV
jgi:uncharacterized protein